MSKQRHTLLLLLVLVFACGCAETTEDAYEYQLRAQEFFDRGQFDLSVVELKNALELNPQLLPALQLQVQLQEKNHDVAGLLGTLDRILAIDPNELSAGLRRAELHLLSASTQPALEQIDHILTSYPNNLQALNLKTAWLLQNDDIVEAGKNAEKALATTTPDETSYVLAAIHKIQIGSYDDAASLLANALRSFPDHALLHMVRIRLALARGHFDEVPQLYEELLLLHPQEMEYWWEYAQYYVHDGKMDKAVELLQEAVAKYPQNSRAKYFLGRLLARSQSPDATDVIEDLIENDQESQNLRFVLAQLYSDNAQYDDAERHYLTIAAATGNSPAVLAARSELARIAIEQQSFAKARQQVEAILDYDPSNTNGLLAKAQLDLQANNPEAAISSLSIVLKGEPENSAGLTLLGFGYLEAGQHLLAVQSFRSALASDPLNETAALELLAIAKTEGDINAIVDLLAPFEAAQTNNAQIELELLRARIATRDWAGAKRLAKRSGVAQANPKLREFVDALHAQDRGQIGIAQSKLQALHNELPESKDILGALVTTMMIAGKHTEAVKVTDKLRQQYPNLSWVDQLLFNIYLQTDQLEEAATLLEERIANGEVSPDSFGRLASTLALQEEYAEAIRALERGIAHHPEFVELRRDRAMLLEASNQTKEAIEAYKELLKLNPADELATNNLAMIYSQTESTLNQARVIADPLRSSREPIFVDTLGWICVQTNELECAIPLLEFAAEKEPDNAEFNFHLGVAYLNADRRDRALIHLRRSQSLVGDGAVVSDQAELERVLKTLNNDA